MTVRSIDPKREEAASATLAAPDAPVQRQETVVTHGRDQDTSERTSVGGPPTGTLAAHAPTPLATTSSRTVVRDEAGGSRRKVAQIRQIIWFAVGFVEIVLALRLVLKLLGAGQAADFTQAVLGLTSPLVMPFAGIFPNAAADNFEFEPASLVAMLVYLLAGLGLVKLVRILYGETGETA